MSLLPPSDLWAVAILIAALAIQAYAARLPRGLAASALVGAITVAAGLLVRAHLPEVGRGLHGVYWSAATLCTAWAMIAWATTVFRPDSAAHRARGVFLAWSLVCGLSAGVITLYLLVFTTWSRLLDPAQLDHVIPASGLWRLLCLAAAVGLWSAVQRRAAQPVLLLVLSAMIVWWSSLMLPRDVADAPSAARSAEQLPTWWGWTFQLQAGLALLLLCAAMIQEWTYRRRRGRAWPDHLDALLEPFPRWPAYAQVESILAAVVLVCGVYHVMRAGPTAWQAGLANAILGIVTGLTSFYMAHRRWSPNSAGLGLALISMSAVALAVGLLDFFGATGRQHAYASRAPSVFNAVLFAMCVMIAWWRWLADFWGQQLLDGAAWTTTGRMIPYNRRTAFLLAGLAVLIAYQMALWPELVPEAGDDNGAGRIAAGLAAIVLVAMLEMRNARREDSPRGAALATALIVCAAIFTFVRMPSSALRGWVKQYDAVVCAGVAMPMLLVAELLPLTRWRSFAWPLWFLALLVLPAASLIALRTGPLPAEWVKPLALAMLGAVYSFAATREHRRAFLVLGVVLLLAACISGFWSYRGVLTG